MKKTGLLLILLFAAAAMAQQAGSTPSDIAGPEGTAPTSASFPLERVQTPTYADINCAGFITKQLVPNANFISGGLETPLATKYGTGDIVYLAGHGYQLGQQYTVVRELRNVNENELFPRQRAILKQVGQPYSELARVRIIDTRSKMAIAQVEFSCDAVNPGDFVVPYVEKPPISFHPPLHFDRFAPTNGKLNGRIVMARDFDSLLGTGLKVYLNVGANQGVKVGDYFRAFRLYTDDLRDPVDSLSFKASTSEDTQKKEPSVDQHIFTKTGGPVIHVSNLPRRAVGEIVILGTTSTTATGMIVFALEDVHTGDHVELDMQDQ